LESLITREDLENFVKKQVEEIIYRLLAWDGGFFKFFEERFPTQEEITIKVSTENLILESVRRLKQTEKVKRKLPPLDAVIGLAPSENGRHKDLFLESDEWNILTLIDGRRRIEEIISDSGLEKEDVLRKITALFLAGLLEKKDELSSDIKSDGLEDLVKKFSHLLEEYMKEKEG
jgi:hypothetical protein